MTRVFLILFLALFIVQPLSARGKRDKKNIEAESDLKAKTRKTEAATAHLRRKIIAANPELAKDPNFNGATFETLLQDDNLTHSEFNAAMKTEHDRVDCFLKENDPGTRTKRWMNQYQKIIDAAWEDELYAPLPVRCSGNEMSSQIGLTTYDVGPMRDENDPSIIWISNFYNVGFPYKLKVLQQGKTLVIPTQTFQSQQIKGSGSIDVYGNIKLNFTVDDGDPKRLDTCEFSCRGLKEN